ncbi:MAG: response regulator transcription factor [Anaerolineales bacterium]
MKALVVDDDLALADVLAFTLRRAGYEVVMAHDGAAALESFENEKPDILILDINLPKLSGLQVCQRIRAFADTPIIFLSVLGSEDDVVQGLKLGGDDYIVKPFSPRQLVARMEAVLRRSTDHVPQTGVIRSGDIELDPARNLLARSDTEPVRLTRLECRLMEVLLLNRGQVLPFDTLVDAVWGRSGGDRTALKQLVYRLRRKIEIDAGHPVLLISIPAVGYSLAS